MNIKKLFHQSAIYKKYVKHKDKERVPELHTSVSLTLEDLELLLDACIEYKNARNKVIMYFEEYLGEKLSSWFNYRHKNFRHSEVFHRLLNAHRQMCKDYEFTSAPMYYQNIEAKYTS